MNRLRKLFHLAAVACCAPGCTGGVKQETIVVKEQDPMLQVRATLLNYVRGQPLASEVTSYDFMVEALRKADPAKADILKAGLDDLKKVKGSPAPKARDLMRRLGLDEKEPK